MDLNVMCRINICTYYMNCMARIFIRSHVEEHHFVHANWKKKEKLLAEEVKKRVKSNCLNISVANKRENLVYLATLIV